MNPMQQNNPAQMAQDTLRQAPQGQAPLPGDQGMPMPEIDPEELQMTLFARIEQLTQPEAQAFASMITPGTAPILFKIFPELGPLFEQVLNARMGSAGGGPQAQAPAAPQNPLAQDGISKGLMG